MNTPEQVNELSDNELRVAIAEALGWTHMRTFIHHKDDSLLFGNPPDGKTFERVPNWTADLNAAAELETDGETIITLSPLGLCGVRIVVQTGLYKFDNHTATAATEARARSEAFYKWWLETHK
jgi:hypothetical protein